MPSAFLLSQLASLQSSVVTASAAEPLWEDVVSFFAERGVPWKPWNLSGSATDKAIHGDENTSSQEVPALRGLRYQ